MLTNTVNNNSINFSPVEFLQTDNNNARSNSFPKLVNTHNCAHKPSTTCIKNKIEGILIPSYEVEVGFERKSTATDDKITLSTQVPTYGSSLIMISYNDDSKFLRRELINLPYGQNEHVSIDQLNELCNQQKNMKIIWLVGEKVINLIDISILLEQKTSDSKQLLNLLNNENIKLEIGRANKVKVHPGGSVETENNHNDNVIFSLGQIEELCDYLDIPLFPALLYCDNQNIDDNNSSLSESSETTTTSGSYYFGDDATDATDAIEPLAYDESESINAIKEYVSSLENSPEKIAYTLDKLIEISCRKPVETAEILKIKNKNSEHIGTKIAQLAIKKGINSLSEKYISLLHLLYKNNFLKKDDIISMLLPRQKNDRLEAFSHAIAGAAWQTNAATKFCSLLSDIVQDDNDTRQKVIEHLSLKQSGYRFKNVYFMPEANFFELSSKSNDFNKNPEAKSLLRNSHIKNLSMRETKKPTNNQSITEQYKNQKAPYITSDNHYQTLQEDPKNRLYLHFLNLMKPQKKMIPQ